MTEPTSRRVVFVVGSGRSGTSTMAGTLRTLGLHVPQPEVVADATNPKGFGEPRWVVDLHAELLARSLAREHGIMVLFMTANAKRIPDGFEEAHGVISKPYTERGVQQALDYVIACREGAGLPSVDTLTFVPFQNRGLRAQSSARG